MENYFSFSSDKGTAKTGKFNISFYCHSKYQHIGIIQLEHLAVFERNEKSHLHQHLNTGPAGFILYPLLVADVNVRKIDAEKDMKVEAKREKFPYISQTDHIY